MTKELAAYLKGWKSYFGFCQTTSLLQQLDQWIRRRLRSMIWKQWKRGKQRYAKLRQLGVGRNLAAQTAGSPSGPWHLANSRPCLTRFPSPTSTRSDFPACSMAMRNPLNRRTRTRIYGGVAGADG
jgi:RNA-directed DNA polymerase